LPRRKQRKAAEARYGYHSFPRRAKTSVRPTNQKGLNVLRSMIRSGLLLPPELVDVPGEVFADGSIGPPSRIGETFGAFTVRTARSLVAEHSQDFGEFAAEFEIARLVELGALPVFYVPFRQEAQNAGMALLGRIGDLSELLEALGREAQADQHAREVVHRALPRGRQLPEVLGGFRAFTSLIYRVGTDKDEVRFFEQREWRLLKNALDPRVYDAAEPTEDERALLREFEPGGYWDKELPFRSGSAPRLARAVFVRSIRGRHFLEYARRLIVPAAVMDEARAIVGSRFPLLEVVTFESLATADS
jgi:hypothetical protein